MKTTTGMNKDDIMPKIIQLGTFILVCTWPSFYTVLLVIKDGFLVELFLALMSSLFMPVVVFILKAHRI